MINNSYATTEEMVIKQIGIDGTLKAIAIDARGLYITPASKVGSPLADVNRYGVDRASFITVLEEQGFDPRALYDEYKHLTNIDTSAPAKKKSVNPIKASKRGGL